MRFYPVFDAAVRSYGEEAAVAYLERLDDKGDKRLSEIAGLTWRDGTDVVTNPDRVLPPNRERAIQFDLPPSNTLDHYVDPYVADLLPTERASDLGIITSRGCAFPCTFCNFAAMSSRKVREHSLDYVHNVLRNLSEKYSTGHPGKILRVAINDDNFSTNAPRMRQLLASLRGVYKNLEFWAEMRVDSLTEADFELMEQAKFSEINIGLDSASPKVIRAAQKIPLLKTLPVDFRREETYRDKILQATQWAKSCNISCCVSIILGLPEEDRTDGLQTLNFVKKSDAAKYAHNFLQIFDGTPLAHDFQRFGITVEPYPGRPLPNITYPNYPTLDLPIIPSDESQLPYRRLMLQSTVTLLTGVIPESSRTVPKSFGRGSSKKATTGLPTTPTLVAFNVGALQKGLHNLLPLIPVRSIGWVLHRNAKLKSYARRLLSQGAPFQEINFLELDDGAVALNRPDKRFGGQPITVFTKKVNAQLEAHRVIDLSSRAAVESLLHELDFSTNRKAWTFGKRHLDHPIVVLDACRWMSKPCPAPSTARLLIERNGSIKSCIRDPGIDPSSVNSLDGLRHARTEQADEARQQRSCSKCSVRNRCSMCHTGIEGSSSSFCKTMQEIPAVSCVVSSIEVLRRLLALGRLESVTDVQVRCISLGAALGKLFGTQRDAVLFEQGHRAILAFDSESVFALNQDTLEAIVALSAD